MTSYKLALPILTFALGPILSYFSLPLITKNISAPEYGLYTYFLSLLSIISFVSLLPALNSTVNRFGSKASKQYVADVCTLKIFYFSSLIVFSLLIFIVNTYYLEINSFEFFIISFSIFCINIFNAAKSYLLINNDKSKYSILVIIINFFSYGYLFYAVNTGDFGVVDILLGNAILFLILVIYKLHSIIGIMRLKYQSTVINKKILKFVAMSFFISLSTIIYNNTDKIMMEALLEQSRPLAIYQVSYQIFAFPIESMYALISIFTPAFLYRAFDKDKDLYKKNLMITFKVILFIIFNLSQVLLMSSDFLKVMLLDPDYISNDSLPLIFIASQSIFLLYLLSTNIFIVHNKRKFLIASLTISSLLNIVLNFLLIPKFGYVGAAISTLISYVLLLVLVFSLSYYIFKVKFLDRNDFLYLSTIPFSCYFFSENVYFWLLVMVVISYFYFRVYIKNTYFSLLRGI